MPVAFTESLDVIAGLLIEWYRQGDSAEVIGLKVGKTESAVRACLKRHGEPLRTTGGKLYAAEAGKVRVCGGPCKRKLPLEAFVRDRYYRGGRGYKCYECHNTYTNGRRIIQSYGISLPEFTEMLARQGGGCAICGRKVDNHKNGKKRRMCVDHDHETGLMRGILCTRCNTGIGMFANDEKLLRRAIKYLQKAKEG